MHEMGIAMQIVEIAQNAIPPGLENPAVARVNLRIGKMTAVVPDSLTFCFDIATRDTPLAGASLVIEELPVNLRCRECDHQWTVSSPEFICPRCGNGKVDMLSGRELEIASIELAD
ncbi:MAG: hydrogenase maturation nickel metallochaperone HypA [Desulfosudaceae bacterium]